MNEEELIFRAYQRGLLRQLTALKAALKNKDNKAAENVLDELIADTKAGIED